MSCNYAQPCFFPIRTSSKRPSHEKAKWGSRRQRRCAYLMWALLVPGCGLPAPEASVARFGCLLGHNRVRQRVLIKSALGTIRAEGDPSGLRVIHSGNLRPRRRPAWVLNIRIGVQCVEGDTTHLLNVHEDCGHGAQPRFTNDKPRRTRPCALRELLGMVPPPPASMLHRVAAQFEKHHHPQIKQISKSSNN